MSATATLHLTQRQLEILDRQLSHTTTFPSPRELRELQAIIDDALLALCPDPLLCNCRQTSVPASRFRIVVGKDDYTLHTIGETRQCMTLPYSESPA